MFSQIIYFDDKTNEKLIYEDGNIKKYKNEIFNDCFIYYNHKNCIGSDIKQFYKMKAIVSINYDIHIN